MVAALALHHEDGLARVGILDHDMHDGNGTEDIIERLGASSVTHFTAGAHYSVEGEGPRMLAELPSQVRAMAGCDVVLYQAGADQHIADALGGLLTTEELLARDRSSRSSGSPWRGTSPAGISARQTARSRK